MMSESRGASNHRCSRDAPAKRQLVGALLSPAAENLLGRIAAAGDLSAELTWRRRPCGEIQTYMTISRVPRAKLLQEVSRRA